MHQVLTLQGRCETCAEGMIAGPMGRYCEVDPNPPAPEPEPTPEQEPVTEEEVV